MILRLRCFGKEDEEEAMLRELKEREDCLVLCCCPSSRVLLFRILDDNHNLFALYFINLYHLFAGTKDER